MVTEDHDPLIRRSQYEENNKYPTLILLFKDRLKVNRAL